MFSSSLYARIIQRQPVRRQRQSEQVGGFDAELVIIPERISYIGF